MSEAFVVSTDLEDAVLGQILRCCKCNELMRLRLSMQVKSERRVDIASASARRDPRSLTPEDRAVIADHVAGGKTIAIVEALREENVPDKAEHCRSTPFACPACGVTIQATFSYFLLGTALTDNAPREKKSPSSSRRAVVADEDQQRFEAWSEAGLVDLFLDAYREHTGLWDIPVPAGSAMNMINRWCKEAQFINPLSLKVAGILRRDLEESGQIDNLKFFHSLGVVGVVADGYLRTFVSRKAVDGKVMSRLKVSDSGKIQNDMWHRTRFGYAVGRGIFFEALHLESRASQGSATRTQRGTT